MKRLRETEVVDNVSPVSLNLPLEIWQVILSFMAVKDLYRCGNLCKTLQGDILHKSINILNLRTFDNNPQTIRNIPFGKLVNVERLYDCCSGPTNQDIACLTNLTHLEVSVYSNIKDITANTKLKVLTMHRCYGEGGELPIGSSKLVNLEVLDMLYHSGGTDNLFIALQKLTRLCVPTNSGFTKHGLLSLTSLKHLTLYDEGYDRIEYELPVSIVALDLGRACISNSLQSLTNLVSLTSADIQGFRESQFRPLTNLMNLTLYKDYRGSSPMDNITLRGLQHLTGFYFETNGYISNAGMALLTNLRHLAISCDKYSDWAHLTSACFSALTNLTTLRLDKSFPLDMNDVRYLCNLTSLDIL